MSMSLKYHDLESSTLSPGVVHGAIHGRGAHSNVGRARGMVERVFATLAQRRERQHSYVYLSRLSDHELTDIGVTREDIEKLRDGIWRRRI